MLISDRDFTLQNISCPFDLMRFCLVFRGQLSASSSKSKPEEIKRIRTQLQLQLKRLWEPHPALIRLRWTARVPGPDTHTLGVSDTPLNPYMSSPPMYPPQKGYVDLTAPIERHGKKYIPLVRKSLDLTCSFKILFLRQEDPGSLFQQAGDLDNRIKTLFDAMKVPAEDAGSGQLPDDDPSYFLMEDDKLISGFDVASERLLLPETAFRNEVHLVVEVIINVLRVGEWNICLVGG